MAFDRDLAVQVAKSRDRDTAPFFAGRRAEIEELQRTARKYRR